MLRRQIAIAVLLALAAVGFADAPKASAVLARAQAEAKAGKKNVMVIFHASWCGWCKKMDQFLADPAMAKLVNKAYVVVHLDVLESPDKKALENEGGVAVMEEYGGKEAGLPFSAVTDASGKLVVNSIRPKSGNIGYPAAPEEIAYFVEILKKSAPKLTDADRKQIEEWLKKNAPKRS